MEGNNVSYSLLSASVNLLKVRLAAFGPLFYNKQGRGLFCYTLLKVSKVRPTLAEQVAAGVSTHSFRVAGYRILPLMANSYLSRKGDKYAFMKYLRFDFSNCLRPWGSSCFGRRLLHSLLGWFHPQPTPWNERASIFPTYPFCLLDYAHLLPSMSLILLLILTIILYVDMR